MMKIQLTVEYNDVDVSANRLADLLLEVEGVDGVEVGEWSIIEDYEEGCANEECLSLALGVPGAGSCLCTPEQREGG